MASFIIRSITTTGILFILFTISLVIMNLVFVYETKNNKIDHKKRTFIEIGNWTIVGLYSIILIGIGIAFINARKTIAEGRSILESRLKDAPDTEELFIGWLDVRKHQEELEKRMKPKNKK